MKQVLDFIVIGAQKAGTTSVFEYLRRHPELYMPPSKEAAYFSHDAEMAHGWDHYLKSNFVLADASRKWGTATPSYMVGGVYDAASRSELGKQYDERTVPLRISRRLPEVRLVAVLREPIDRARSHHKMMVMNGRERRSFDEAIAELLRPQSLVRSRAVPEETTGYVTWGEYGRILAGYFEVFPREQMLITFTDDLDLAPGRFLVRAHEFLGVKPHLIPDNLGTRYREGGTTRRFSQLNPSMIAESIARNLVMRRLWHSLPQASRLRIRHGYAGLAYRIDLWNRSSQTMIDEPAPATLARLREHFAQDSDRLSELLGEIPPWQQSPGTA